MDRIGAAARPPARERGSAPDMHGIVQQLAAALAARGRGEALQPLPEAWDALLQLESDAKDTVPWQKRKAALLLPEALRAAGFGALDGLLFKGAVHAALGLSQGVSLVQYLADRASDALCLPELRPREVYEVEHDSFTFNRVLPLFAASTYDYDVLGRTLLWKGGCHLFDGLSGAERGDKLRRAIFCFSLAPRFGERALEDMSDFVTAMGELGLYEPMEDEAEMAPLRASTSAM